MTTKDQAADAAHAVPDKQVILDFIKNSSEKVGKREIARAFSIKGAARIRLKQILRDLAAEGLIETDKVSGLRLAGDLPAVCMIEITGRDQEGCFVAQPTQNRSDSAVTIEVFEPKRGYTSPLRIGDRALARLSETGPNAYRARIIKRISRDEGRIIGKVQMGKHGARLIPSDRRERNDYLLEAHEAYAHNDLIIAERVEGRHRGDKRARFVEYIAPADAPHAFSMIAIAEQAIPFTFSEPVLAEAEALPELPDAPRQDLTAMPFITIDPHDARDHDDAICVHRDGDTFILSVAIADVAAFVRSGSALDLEARKRGNSVYLPDRVVPMLPERLSTDLCSLRADETRPAMVAHITIAPTGERLSHRFERALIRIAHGYSYEQAQKQFDAISRAAAHAENENLMNIWACYQAMAIARDKRRPLDLNRPERKVSIDAQGQVANIYIPPRLEAHRLIEEMMVSANICAAETLEANKTSLLFRIHDAPSLEKVRGFAGFVRPFGVKFDLGQPVVPHLFNRVLSAARDSDHYDMVSEAVLRSQAQAAYAVDNIGHFGLNLSHYAHFTSPIRRYADLIVHRALITALKLGQDGLSKTDIEQMHETAERISQAERRAMLVERSAGERYLSSYMSQHIGEDFDGIITGLSRAGLFVRLQDTGAEGLIPISRLGGDRFIVDESGFTMSGLSSGLTFRLGSLVRVTIEETMPLKGGVLLSLQEGGELRSRSKPAAKGRQRKAAKKRKQRK